MLAWTAGNSSVCIRRRIVSVRPRSTLEVGLFIFLEKRRVGAPPTMSDALHPGDEEVGGGELPRAGEIGEAHGLGEDGGGRWRTASRGRWKAADELKAEKSEPETTEAVEQVAADGPSAEGWPNRVHSRRFGRGA